MGSDMQVGMNTLDCYEQDFEVKLLEASAEYYKRKAATWIQACAMPCKPLCSLCCFTYCARLGDMCSSDFVSSGAWDSWVPLYVCTVQ